jgi:hypothetical protein
MSQLAPLGWTCDTKLGGAGSYFWTSPDGKKEFHFRNGGHGAIDVNNRYYLGKRVMTIRTESDCRILVKQALK